jgi:hypothetical protein
MTQLREPLPLHLTEIRSAIESELTAFQYVTVDASEHITGRDFLLKIWNLLLSAPLGIAIIHEGMPPATVANIFFELGMMQAYGKELLVVKTPAAVVPSDLVRTEYLEWGATFGDRLRRFMDGLLERAQYYETVAEQLDRNPLLAIDYLRRAYLITGANEPRARARALHAEAGTAAGRARNSVESLFAAF